MRAARTTVRRLGVQAPRPAISGWPVEALVEDEEPETSGNEPGSRGVQVVWPTKGAKCHHCYTTAARNMPSPLTKDLTRRLAFVRYLQDLGVDQSHKPEPFAAFAVLTFHDACEMFLQIAAEHNGVTFERFPDLLEYWRLFEQQKKLQVTLKPAMVRLNKARGNLKHGGLLPAYNDIEGFRATVTSFLKDNALQLLGVNFDDVSLTSMIKADDVREPLERAQKALSDGGLKSALEEAALAFTTSLRRFENRPRASTRPYSLRSASTNIFEFVGRPIGDEFRDIGLTLNRAVDVFSEAITVVAYNLDFDSYLMFKTHAPVVMEFPGGRMEVQWTRQEPTDPDVVQRCLNFVIDTAIRLEALA
jgi:hypothetical protein